MSFVGVEVRLVIGCGVVLGLYEKVMHLDAYEWLEEILFLMVMIIHHYFDLIVET